MLIFKRGLPVAIAVIGGLFTLFSLLFAPALAGIILDWVGFIAAAALILGILNLLGVHARRMAAGNGYSAVLIVGMVAVFGLAVTDALGQTQGGVLAIFNLVQLPLEAALGSLLAFFLLFASVRMMHHRRNLGAVLFLASTLFFLLAQGPQIGAFNSWLLPLRNWLESVVVVAGMRGLLLGIALGVVTLAVRLLVGIARPYSS